MQTSLRVDARPAVRQKFRRLTLLDVWTILLLAVPVFGCFFPLESYMSLGEVDGSNGEFANLPIPVTSLTLLLTGLSAAFYYWQIMIRQKVDHVYVAYFLLGLAFFSAIWALQPNLTILRALRYMPFILLSISLPQYYGNGRLLRLMTIAFLCCAIASIFMGAAVPSLGSSRLGGGYEGAWRGSFVHKNLTGIVFAIGVLVAWTAWCIRSVRLKLAGVTALLCLAMVVLSESGTALGGLILSIPIALMLRVIQRMPARLRPVLFLSFLFIAIALSVGIVFILEQILTSSGRDMTFTGRTPIWAVVWQLIQVHPFRGMGYAFWVTQGPDAVMVSDVVGTVVGHAHNSWLDLWLQLGFLGLMAMVLITLEGFRLSVKLILITDHPIAAPLFALQFLLVFRSMTEVQYSDPFPSLLFFPIWTIVAARVAFRDVAARRAAAKPVRVTPPDAVPAT